MLFLVCVHVFSSGSHRRSARTGASGTSEMSDMHENPNFSRGVATRSTYSYNPRRTGGVTYQSSGGVSGGGGSNSQPTPGQSSGFFKRLIPTRFSSRR